MNIIITGGAGMLGKKLALALLQKGHLTDANGAQSTIDKLVVFDVVKPEPPLPDDPRLEIIGGNITDPQTVRSLITPDADLIFHLAAVVSAGAEADFELGLRVNLSATWEILECCRRMQNAPKLVFASSVAVFGGDMPPTIEDMTAPTPQSSYGAQKAIGELLINDYSRKGFIDGRALRFPTIVVRPGKPNKAASTFASSIIREPLQGQPVVCPVSPETRMWILSPRRAIDAFIHAAQLPASAWGYSRTVSLPGLSVSIQEMVDALGQIAGSQVVERITWQPDPFIQKLVSGWPVDFAPTRALSMGFMGDESVQEIIQAFIDDGFQNKSLPMGQ